MNQPQNVDAYISAFPPAVQSSLESIREAVRAAAPRAEEVISYGMPAYKLGKVLVYFAAFKNHIGFYPTPSGVKAFEHELGKYVYAKGSIQFPLDKPLPLGLIKKIVRFRVQEAEMPAKQK